MVIFGTHAVLCQRLVPSRKTCGDSATSCHLHGMLSVHTMATAISGHGSRNNDGQGATSSGKHTLHCPLTPPHPCGCLLPQPMTTPPFQYHTVHFVTNSVVPSTAMVRPQPPLPSIPPPYFNCVHPLPSNLLLLYDLDRHHKLHLPDSSLFWCS